MADALKQWKKAEASKGEETIVGLARMRGLSMPRRNLLAIPGRKLEFDIAWPQRRLAIEYQGGVWKQNKASEPCPACGQFPKGAHGHGWGIARDIEKLVLAQLCGWLLLPVEASMIGSRAARGRFAEQLVWLYRHRADLEPWTTPPPVLLKKAK